MPNDKDLFAEEQSMVSMSFGDHIEDLRYRLILALAGLFLGLIATFVPLPVLGESIGMYVFDTMEMPARQTLETFYNEQAITQSEEARKSEKLNPPVVYYISAREFVTEIAKIAPQLAPMLPEPKAVTVKDQDPKTDPFQEYDPRTKEYREKRVTLTLVPEAASQILNNRTSLQTSPLVSLAPLETITIYFMICLVSGLVLTSPWVFYHVWAFIAAGLYRHERHYVKKFLPFSLGLFLSGVFLCFFGVLPYTLKFLLQFNVWLGIAPTMRITDWMSFATILPLVFGLCFQTPLVMLFLERIGIVSADNFRAKRKIAIVIIVAIAAVVTPGPDMFSQVMLAIPMVLLYELGIILMVSGKPKVAAPVV